MSDIVALEEIGDVGKKVVDLIEDQLTDEQKENPQFVGDVIASVLVAYVIQSGQDYLGMFIKGESVYEITAALDEEFSDERHPPVEDDFSNTVSDAEYETKEDDDSDNSPDVSSGS